MALQTLTFLALQNAARHALGKDPDSNTTSLADIVNDSLQELCNAHPWNWKEKAFALNTTASTNYVALPSDFGQLKSIALLSSVGVMRPVTMEEIIRYRATTDAVVPYGYCWAISMIAQASLTALPQYKLELWPTPNATSSNTPITGVYIRQLPKLANDTDIADIPANFHSLLKALVRARAQEEDGNPMAKDSFARYTGLLEPYKLADGNVTNIGMIRGAVPFGVGGQRKSIRQGDTISFP